MVWKIQCPTEAVLGKECGQDLALLLQSPPHLLVNTSRYPMGICVLIEQTLSFIMDQKRRWARRQVGQPRLTVPQWKVWTECTNQRTVWTQRHIEASVPRGLLEVSSLCLILHTSEKNWTWESACRAQGLMVTARHLFPGLRLFPTHNYIAANFKG